jgi:hypothetical protein
LHIIQDQEDFNSGFKIVGSASDISGRIWMKSEKLHIDNATAGANSGFTFMKNGNIGVGATEPAYKLSVKGTIGCGEVIVEDVSGWADFVFEDDYNLMSLKDLENYIKVNKHLPEIPTTAEVEENGISVGEMNAKLLQKVEELTLYTIQQQEIIEALKENLEAQNKRIEKLENN